MPLAAELSAAGTPEAVLAAFDAAWDSQWHAALVRSRPVLLLSCGTSDITQPYHSLSYLAGALSQAAIPYAVRDLNIEFWHYVSSPPVVDVLRQECLDRERKSTGDNRRLLTGYAARLEDRGQYQRAWQTLRSKSGFFDLSTYLPAVHALSDLPRLLTLLSGDCIYRTFSSMSPPGSMADRIDLQTLRDSALRGTGIGALDHFYAHHAHRISQTQWSFVGFTVPFLSQLYHSLILGSLLKQLGCRTAVGGPIAAKFYKYANRASDLERLSFAFDLLVTGEGESLVCQLPSFFARRPALTPLRNTVDLSKPQPVGEPYFENVNELPAPDYSVWNYDLYASPEPGGLYSPTRGCYWNKCSFCDYGLSMKGPTSPWRVREPHKVADDLCAASAYIRYFFFSVDVLSPAYARKLAQALVDAKVGLIWMADFRLEKSLNKDAMDVFWASGCRGAAFGMESASARVLAQMQKGTLCTEVPRLVSEFQRAGIAVQLMGFVGFPSETLAEARETLSSARELRKIAATVAVGRFGLTPGSDVAKKPNEYGVAVAYEDLGLPAIPWELQWRHVNDSARTVDLIDDAELLEIVRGFPFPFLGSTTTLHSLLYFARFPNGSRRVPRWAPDGSDDPDIEFAVIPAYFTLNDEAIDRVLLQSALTGRVVEADRTIGALLAHYFSDGWVKRGGSDIIRSPLLGYLIEHSLALFLPWGELTDAEQAAVDRAAACV